MLSHASVDDDTRACNRRASVWRAATLRAALFAAAGICAGIAPSPAIASSDDGTPYYEVTPCGHFGGDPGPGDGLGVATSPDALGAMATQLRCSRRNERALVSTAPIPQSGVAAWSGETSWTLTAAPNTTIDAFGLAINAQLSGGLEWELTREPGTTPLRRLSQSADLPHGRYTADGATSVRGRLFCREATPCAGSTSSSVRSELWYVEVGDDIAPTLDAEPTGSLFDEGVVRGTRAVDFAARDLGGGVYWAGILSSGPHHGPSAYSRGPVLPGDARCAHPFMYMAPCPGQFAGTHVIDTRNLPEGEQRVQLYVDDAAWNRVVSRPRTITVDNVPNPEMIAGPAITGPAIVGGELRSTLGTWSGASGTPSVTWHRCDQDGANCQAIPGATGLTYRLTASDVGRRVRSQVTVYNSANETAHAYSGAMLETVADPPRIRGVARVGETLTGEHHRYRPVAADGPVQLSVVWERCHEALGMCEPLIDSRGSSELLLRSNEVGTRVRFVVTATAVWSGVSTTLVSEPTGWIASGEPAAVEPPTISGRPIEGTTLTADAGRWVGQRPFMHAHAWQACDATGADCTAIDGATSATLELGPALVGRTVRAQVTTSGPAGAGRAISAPSALIAGRPPVLVEPPRLRPPAETVVPPPAGSALAMAIRVGGTLNVGGDAWDGTDELQLQVQWQRCSSAGERCGAIPHVTDRTYRPTGADVGQAVRAEITARNVAGTAHAVTDPVLILDRDLADDPPRGPDAREPAGAPPLSRPGDRRGAVLSVKRPARSCVPRLRVRLPGDGNLSVRGTLPGSASVLAGGRPLLTLAEHLDAVMIRTAAGRTLGVAEHAGGLRWLRRSATRVAARSANGRLLVAIGAAAGRRGEIVVKGRSCTVTPAAERPIAARADRPARTDVFLVDDAGAPLADRTIEIREGAARQTLRTDVAGRARVTLSAAPGSRTMSITFAGDPDHHGAALQVPVRVRAVTSVAGRVVGARVQLTGRLTGAPSTPLRLEYRDRRHRWRVLGTATTTANDTWTLRTARPAAHAGGTQLVVRAVLLARSPFAGRAGGEIRIDLSSEAAGR